MPMDYYSSRLKASPGLENLAVDILIQIQKHLDGKDIIVLRKSCKKMHAVTQRRIVWLNAVRRMCRRHGVFAPSFPLEDMSTTELEHASLCPSRLSSLIHNGVPLRSFVTRILEPRTPSIVPTVEGNLHCKNAFLIPGGRFLVVNSTHHGICLWDLGIHGGKAPRFRPVAVIPELDHSFLCGPTQDGLGIILISWPTSNPSGSNTSDRTLRAYEIYPCMNSPRFTLLGSIRYPQQDGRVARSPALYDNLLVFELHTEDSPDYIVAWNIRLDTAIAWRHDHRGLYDLDDVIIYEGGVVVIKMDELFVWDIPPLRPLFRGIYEVIDQTPRYAITHPFRSQEDFVGSSVLGPWFASIDPPISFGILGSLDPGEKCVMLCYTLRSINPSRDPILPMLFPIKMGMVPNLPIDTNADGVDMIDFSGPLRYCDDELCYISASIHKMFISLITPPTSLNGPSSSKSSALFKMSDPGEFRSWNFCAASGRLVVVDDTTGIIHIMDYLVPPSS
ncbi:uncharacterized protein LACBIDRAFT_306761 [Laccaria bicolor S238N-H82]|uniref:Predicted protein n=1 Tax=Laccaria bicolor (strain S238N-H82 / ATCC MYA-4686) TaxID=486041 RepID=B0DNM5_LACBS|nr:uncharacterized protein LACBIDRAFT_306761 [Laccaria bicolor S238N-H82]EDR03746.1 predicted protein [Laccaria bicolor S238N-H82]|eukprot:XP_001885599.1 predicted protein [Laccaria bicolor S238N-H82]